MNNATKHSFKIAMGLMLATGMNFATAQPEAAAVCADCHGEAGVSSDPGVPTIAGVGAFFLENQFAIYAEEARPCAAEAFADHAAENHCTAVQGLSEEQAMALAEYYGDQEFVPFEQDYDQALAEQGEALHEEDCSRCHTAGGAEVFDDAGVLAGQPIPYMIHQFEVYKAGERWQPESMAEVMELSEEQMKALAHYYAAEGLN